MTPSVGRIVHYVSRGSADGVFPAVCRAAIITEAPSPLPTSPTDHEPVGLFVANPEGLFLNRHVLHDEGGRPGTWHWPERVDEKAATGPYPAIQIDTGAVTAAGGWPALSEEMPGC